MIWWRIGDAYVQQDVNNLVYDAATDSYTGENSKVLK
jgi:hypothetical protein